jgi:starch synthase
MNIIIDDDDYPLIIKVASLPSSRLQVYFLDNEDYFKRKSVFEDEEGKPFDDNHERMVFFSKSALEIVRKFGWAPDIIHVHGWMTSLIPLFVKSVYQNEPIFKNSKVVYSLYDNSSLSNVPANFEAKAGINNMDQTLLAAYTEGDQFTEHRGAMHYADAIIKGSEMISENVLAMIPADKPTLEYHGAETYLPSYVDFYKTLLIAPEEEK